MTSVFGTLRGTHVARRCSESQAGRRRFADLVDHERAQFYEAVLSVGPDAYLTRDAVLAFHDLALVNPSRIRVGTKRRVRRQLPDYIEVVREDLPTADLTIYDGLASATVTRALHDCIGMVMTDRLVDAAQHARDEGLIHRREHDTRFTRDLDFSHTSGMTTEDFEDELFDKLAQGWHGVAGRLVSKRKAQADGVPSECVMQPYEIKLSFNGDAWTTVAFELGHPEIDSADTPEYRLGEDIAEIFDELGLSEPGPIAVMSAAHHAAQKIHACTGPGASQRAHDLIDLQLIDGDHRLDPVEVAAVGSRLFAYRRQQTWPPEVVTHDALGGSVHASGEGTCCRRAPSRSRRCLGQRSHCRP